MRVELSSGLDNFTLQGLLTLDLHFMRNRHNWCNTVFGFLTSLCYNNETYIKIYKFLCFQVYFFHSFYFIVFKKKSYLTTYKYIAPSFKK